MPYVYPPLATGAGGGGGAGGGNTIIVDATGTISSYTTIAAGMAAATAGDVVTVYPGTYTDSNVTGNNVTLNFLPGVSLLTTAATGTDACFKFDSTHVFSIVGAGHFRIINPSASNGDVASPCIFSVAGGVTITVECGLLEGYQIDGSKVGQHFIAGFDHTTASDLTVLCSGIGGNLIVGSLDGVVNTLGCFGLAGNFNGTSGTQSNFHLTCTGNIACVYDGNKNSLLQQFFYTFKIKALNDIYIKQRVVTATDPLSFYQCVNFCCTTLTGNFKCSGTEVDILTILAELITGFNGFCSFALDSGYASHGGSFNGLFKASNAARSDAGLNIDTSVDSAQSSSLTIDIPYIISGATVKLYGLVHIRCAVWITGTNGFDAGTATGGILFGYTLTDAGFAQGTAPIVGGVLEVNAAAF